MEHFGFSGARVNFFLEIYSVKQKFFSKVACKSRAQFYQKSLDLLLGGGGGHKSQSKIPYLFLWEKL